MSDRILQLGRDELWRVLELIDPVELMVAQLSGQAVDREVRESCRLAAAPAAAVGAPVTEPVLLEDSRTGVRCLLSASSLADLRTAALVAMAARQLLTPSVVTVAALGSGPAVQLQLAVLARHVPTVGFVALWPAGDEETVPVDRPVLDLLESVGVSLLLAGDAEEAMFGANLLLGAGPGQDHLGDRRLALGAVVVNTTGHDLPDHLVDGVDGIYVDDSRLLETNRHRRFVQLHLDQVAMGGVGGGVEPRGRSEGWHRNQCLIQADLAQVLTGVRPGRKHIDDVLLVELLGLRELDLTLACLLQRAALDLGVGAWLFE
jgi:ornithine cyclodeaminase/alanine dehydrogenase-like protein (mu-crystallin family)